MSSHFDSQTSVYVAGSTKDTERINVVQGWVRDLGWTITFDWTGPEGEIRNPRGGADFETQAGGWAEAPEKGAEISTREIKACRAADLTILLFPPKGGGLGCWIEMGATLASGGEVWVVEPQRDSVFWMHPNVRVFHSLDALSLELDSYKGVQDAA
jgi:hypothetical protein